MSGSQEDPLRRRAGDVLEGREHMTANRVPITLSAASTVRRRLDVARGARLSAAMLARGLTYNCQVCYDLGVTESSLSRWRSGGPISVAMAVALASRLDVTVDWLVRGRSGQHSATARSDFDALSVLFARLWPTDRLLLLSLSRALAQQQASPALEGP
jgi:transcriptional regulator with XRE-family HTH domain